MAIDRCRPGRLPRSSSSTPQFASMSRESMSSCGPPLGVGARKKTSYRLRSGAEGPAGDDEGDRRRPAEDDAGVGEQVVRVDPAAGQIAGLGKAGEVDGEGLSRGVVDQHPGVATGKEEDARCRLVDDQGGAGPVDGVDVVRLDVRVDGELPVPLDLDGPSLDEVDGPDALAPAQLVVEVAPDGAERLDQRRGVQVQVDEHERAPVLAAHRPQQRHSRSTSPKSCGLGSPTSVPSRS